MRVRVFLFTFNITFIFLVVFMCMALFATVVPIPLASIVTTFGNVFGSFKSNFARLLETGGKRAFVLFPEVTHAMLAKY